MRLALGLIVTITAFLIGSTVQAGTVTLPWSTTFNCAEQKQASNGGWTINCDGISSYGSWCASNCTSGGEQITSAANYSGGGGGRGQRQWNGDGSNVVSGSMSVDWTAVPEIYIRWYMRYQSGYAWSPLSYDKTFYMNGNTIPEIQSSDNWNFFNGSNHTIANAGFATMNGGSTGDGQFHCFEIHMKRNGGANDDLGEVWIDGDYKGSVTGFDYTADFNQLIMGENQCCPANGGLAYLDYDDYAVQTTGPIGCIAGGDTTPPAAPTGPYISLSSR